MSSPCNPTNFHEKEIQAPGFDFEPFPEPQTEWEPPPEPHKPYIPYKRGSNFTIYRHTPVPPFGAYYASRDGERNKVSSPELRNTTVADLCHAHPPLEGKTLRDSTRRLEITEAIEVKDGHGAQVFLCRLNSEPTEYVAKVYDPLYYGFVKLIWSDCPRDVTFEADGDYSREVAAYEYLDKQGFRCADVPRYYGSWTFEVPTDTAYVEPRTGTHTRPVRMILMEYLDGKTMLDINLARALQEHRLTVLSRVAETVSKLHHIGLSHGDVSQRNVMVCGYDSTIEEPSRVSLFDFNMSVIRDLSRDVVEKGMVHERTKLPVSPADVFWSTGTFEFRSWFPQDWEDQTREWQGWLLGKYTDSPLFEPPKASLEDDEQTLSKPAGGFDEIESGFPESEQWRTRGIGQGFSPELSEPTSPSNHTSPKRNSADFEKDDFESTLELTDPKQFDQSNQVPMEGRKILGHISIGVKDYDIAKRFYSAALNPLGLELVYASEHQNPSSAIRTLGYGPDVDTELLNIFEYGEEAHAPGRGFHIAFNAPSRKAVDEFHQQALLHGGTCDGKPGPRPRYGPLYYAAFVICPDGWRLEAVCKAPE